MTAPPGGLPDLVGALGHLVRREEDDGDGPGAQNGVEGGRDVFPRLGADGQVEGEGRGRFGGVGHVRGHGVAGRGRLGRGRGNGRGRGRAGGSGCWCRIAVAVVIIVVVIEDLAVGPAAQDGGGRAQEEVVVQDGVAVLDAQQGAVVRAVKRIGQAEEAADGVGRDVILPVLPEDPAGDGRLAGGGGGGVRVQVEGHGLAGEVIEDQALVVVGEAVVHAEVDAGGPAVEDARGDVDPAAGLDGGRLDRLGGEGVVQGQEEQAPRGRGRQDQQSEAHRHGAEESEEFFGFHGGGLLSGGSGRWGRGPGPQGSAAPTSE